MTCQQVTFDLVELHQNTIVAAQMAERQGLPETARALFAVAKAFPVLLQARNSSTQRTADACADHKLG